MAVTSIEDLSARQRAAVVVMSLGPDAGGLMAQLGESQLERLAEEYVRIGPLPERVRDEVLAEFHNRLSAHRIVDGGLERAAKVLEANLGKEQAAQAVQRMEWRANQKLRSFARLDPLAFAKIVENEHPQTGAFLLTQLDESVSARVVEELPEKLQHEIVWRIATMRPIPPDVAAAVHAALAPIYRTQAGSRRPESFGGEQKAAGLLTMVASSAQRLVLETLGELDEEVARRVRKLMFVFRDLLRVDDRGMQRVLKNVDTKTLATALKNADSRIQEKVFKNVSERTAQTIQEEMEYLQAVKPTDIEEARDTVIEAMRELEEKGEIVVDRTSGSEHVG